MHWMPFVQYPPIAKEADTVGVARLEGVGVQCGHIVGGAGDGVLVSVADADVPNDADGVMDGELDAEDVADDVDVAVCDGVVPELRVIVGDGSGNAPPHTALLNA